MRVFSLVVLAALFLPGTVWSASPYKKTLSVKKNLYVRDGVFIGGEAGRGSSLLGMRRTFSPKLAIERVVMDLGDHEAKPRGEGYFQISVDAKMNRIVVDLAQLKLSRVSEAQLRNLFMKSAYVSSVSMTLDPEDQAATMVLDLKRPVRLEVFQLLAKDKPARVVMDIRPLTASAKVSKKKGKG